MPSQRTLCCHCRTMRSCTARVHCLGECLATNGIGSPICGPCTRTCSHTLERNCCLWVQSLDNLQNGVMTEVLTGTFWSILFTRAFCRWSVISTHCIKPSLLLLNFNSNTGDLNGWTTEIATAASSSTQERAADARINC